VAPSTLFRLSGLALLIALPIQVLGFALHPPSEEVHNVLKPIYGPAHMILLVSWAFVLLGIPGLYARQSHRAGVLGLVAFCLLMLAAAYHVYLLTYEAFATPLLAENPATQGLVGPGEPLAHGVQTVAQLATPLVLAFTLFGIATLRARVFPRWTGWLQIAAVPMALIGSMVMEAFLSERLWNSWPAGISPLAFGYYMVFIGYAGAGYRLWSEGRISPTVTENESRATEPKASVQIS
jgi:hypothetical protein